MDSARIEIQDGDGSTGLPEDLGEFKVFMDLRRPLPQIELMRQKYESDDNVSGIFDGKHHFIEHPSRKRAIQGEGTRIMTARCFGRDMRSEEVIEEMLPFGWIPVGEKGAWHFSSANPDLQRMIWIIALGSHTMSAVGPLVTALSGGPTWRSFGSRDFNTKWDGAKYFLFEKTTLG